MGRAITGIWVWGSCAGLLLVAGQAAAQQWPPSENGLIAASLNTVRAQDSPYDEPLTTDRPDFTEASSSVGRGVLQLESGYTFFYDDDDVADVETRGHSGPEMLWRYGVTDSIELRLVWNYFWEDVRVGGVSDRADGAEDLVLGTKIELTEFDGFIPESALIVDFSVPTGGGAFSNEHVETGLNLLYSWDLSEQLSLAGSTGHGTATEQGVIFDRHNVFHQSVALGRGFSERIGGYIEYFGLYYHERGDNAPENYIDGGFTFLYDNNHQFDIRAGTGLNEAADDFFGGVGYSVRM